MLGGSIPGMLLGWQQPLRGDADTCYPVIPRNATPSLALGELDC